ncbi:MAG TPA: hypothetical protein VFW86_05755 [Candidatus Limnocylindrales bacterium]|jgi:hypothetical protein|nr:hypothetical protein [Candidatus Limnocylindrales bacterium]
MDSEAGGDVAAGDCEAGGLLAAVPLQAATRSATADNADQRPNWVRPGMLFLLWEHDRRVRP